ncbi:MAG: cupin domain-containing protein [Deltaproteobacteria bacterium]|nr:cupin domain-containing protein [Deltaproteobacteria bacterium]
MAMLATHARAEEPLSPAKALETLLNAERPSFHRCWEKAAADDYRLAGDIVLRLTLDGAGKAHKVEVVSDTTKDPVLSECLVELAGRFQLGGFSDGDSVELPLHFVAPAAQYTVRSEDVVPHKPKGGKLETRVLVDRASTGAEKASLLTMAISGRVEIPLHRHDSVEVLHVMEGSGRLRGAGGGRGISLEKGDFVYIRGGVVHGLSFTASTAKPTKLVVLYAPGGPERPFKGGNADARATQVVPSFARMKPDPPEPMPLVQKSSKVTELAIAGGKGGVKILFDKETTGDPSVYVGWLRVGEGATVPEHVHAQEAEILHVVRGSGEMTVEGESMPVLPGMSVHIPPNTKHSFKVTSSEPVEAVQFYAPSGPEQRFKAARK